jgi:hypothetical protein
MSMRTPGADPRFDPSRRGPYWRPGDSVIAEPWVALAETNTGHGVYRFGKDRDRAAAEVARWEALARVFGDRPDPSGRLVVGGALVDPHGGVVSGWGVVPVPGGISRWSKLRRLLEARECGRCGSPRWPGCWVAADLGGCAVCLPETEAADPRCWPADPTPPSGAAVVVRAPARRARPRAVAAVSGPTLL